MNAWEATAPSPSLRGWNWTVVGPVRVLLSFPSSLQHRKKEQGASVLAGGSDNEQLPYSTWHCRANTPVIFPSGVNQPDFLFSVQNVVNQNHLIQTEWYFGVSTLIFPSSPLLFFFLEPYLPSQKYNMDWTKVTAGYFSSGPLQISPPTPPPPLLHVNICQAGAELRFTRLVQHDACCG